MNTLLTLLFTLLAIPSQYRMMVISDPHVLDQSLFDVNSASMQAKMANDINQSQYAQAAFNQLIDQALKEKPDVVLIPGDMTDNGSKVDHLSVANQLRRLKDAGIPVCLIPGDHDIYNYLAASYLGAEAQPIANIDDAEFDSIYAFLNESWPSLRRDPNSHSYVVTLAPRLTLIGADCTHGYADSEAAGEFYEPTLYWILQQADSAKAKGDRVIMMMHYQLLEHFDGKGTLIADAMVKDYDDIAQAFYAHGIDLVLTGHMHIDNVTTKYMSKDLSKSIVEIATGSPILYPNPYRMITASETWSKFACETRYITSLSGYSAFSSANNKSRLESYLRYTMIPQYIEKLWAEWVETGNLEALVQAQDFSSLPDFISNKKSDVITLMHDVAAKYSKASSRAELVDSYASGDLVKSAIIHIDGNEGNQNTSDLKSNLKTDCYNMVRKVITTTYNSNNPFSSVFYTKEGWLIVLDAGYAILAENDNLNNALDGFFGDYTRYAKDDQNRTDDLTPNLQFTALTHRDYFATVTFDLMGYGDNFVQKVLINDPAKISRPKDPTADGMYFVNWYSDPELTQLYDFNTEIISDDDVAITLYAKFIPVITFTLGDVKKMYDGTPIAPLYKYKGSLPKDCKEQVEVDTIITNVDSVTYRVSKTTIWNGDNDVTANYKIEWSQDAASMVITPRAIAITTGSASGTYNGVALTSNDTTMSGDGFVAGEGIDITYTGTQTLVGTSNNTITYTAQEGTLLDNYTITVTSGTLTIAPVAISIALRDSTKLYDGTILEATDQVEGTLVEGEQLIVTMDTAITNVDTMVVGIKDLRIMRGEKETTNQYTITYTKASATLIILPREITIGSASDSKVYDGTALTKDSVWIDGEFAQGEGLTAHATGSQTQVGTAQNTIDYTANEGTMLNNYVISITPGQLEVTPAELSLSLKDASKIYDGDTLRAEYTLEGNLAAGDEVKVYLSNNEIVNADTMTTILDSVVILNAANENVTAQYAITQTKAQATLIITPRSIEITTGSASGIYNGVALTAQDTTMVGDGFVEGEGVAVTFTGTVTKVDTVANTMTYEALEGTNLANYVITIKTGSLVITQRPLTINMDADLSKMYDGIALEATYQVDGELATGDSLTVTIENGTRTNVGTDTAAIKYLSILNAALEDVTSQYAISSSKIMQALEITKRSIEITTASAEKEYDGEALVADSMMLTAGDGFVEGEGIVVTSWGSQIEEGSSYNTIDYVALDGTNLNNYDITIIEGILTITPQSVIPTNCESPSSSDRVDKFILNEKLYIRKGGVLYDATGKTLNQ